MMPLCQLFLLLIKQMTSFVDDELDSFLGKVLPRSH